ncbi:MAG: hypothetical protein HYZ16_09210 [Bacteroidetes bacterium]|nr:hypothetical protein [Bacteroidota bacterium]
MDLTGVEVDLEWVRLESHFQSFREMDLEGQVAKLQQAHPDLMEVFIEQLARAGQADNIHMPALKRMVLDTNYKQVLADVRQKYPNLDEVEPTVNEAFRRVKYYFPNDTLPERCYTLATGFQVPGFTYKRVLAISLDWYMDPGYDYYSVDVFPRYMQRRMRSEYIAPQVIKSYFTNRYPIGEHTDGTLLSEMVYYGLLLEYNKMMLPELSDTLILEYQTKQMKWAEGNQAMVYQYFVDNDLWYSTDQLETQRFVSDGPFTVAPNFGPDSAPRIGYYIGWQIVKGYLRHAGKDLHDILTEKTSYLEIFKGAKYKPLG